MISDKRFLLFPVSSISTYSISNTNRQLDTALFDINIKNYILKMEDNLLLIDGVYKTDKVSSGEYGPVDGDIVIMEIPVGLNREKINSLLTECKLITADS